MATNRWPGVFKRGGRWSYRAQFGENGGRWGVSGSGFATAREAWEARNMALKQSSADRGNGIKDGNQTLAEYLEAWLENQSRTVRLGTASTYRARVTAICAHPLAQTRLRALVESDYRRLIADIGAGARHATVMAKLNTVRAALNAAVRAGLLPSNPTAQIRVSRTTPRFEAETWDVDTALRFLAHRKAARDPLYEAWHLALVTGLRRGELHGLKRSDFDLDQRVLHVRRQRTSVRGRMYEGPAKTEGSEAPVFLDQGTCDLLRDHTWVSEYFVTDPRTSRPYANIGTFRADWRRACRNAGVPAIRFHDLRHTTASFLAAAGVPLDAARDRLRHWSTSMTAQYTHVHNTVALQVADRIGAVLSVHEVPEQG